MGIFYFTFVAITAVTKCFCGFIYGFISNDNFPSFTLNYTYFHYKHTRTREAVDEELMVMWSGEYRVCFVYGWSESSSPFPLAVSGERV